MVSSSFFALLLLATLGGWVGLYIFRVLHCLWSAQDLAVRIHLKAKEPSSGWNRKGRVQARRKELEGHGFRWFADYSIPEMPYMYLSCLVDRQGVTAVIYDHPMTGVCVDLFARYGERGGLTVSNMSLGENLEGPPWAKRIRVPKAGVEKLVQLFRQESGLIPAYEWVPITPENFVESFESYYADETDWRNSRGGPSLREVALQARYKGVPEESQVLVKTWEDLRKNAGKNFRKGLIKRLEKLCEGKLPCQPEDLLFVYESLSLEALTEVFASHLERESGFNLKLPWSLTEMTAVDAFWAVQAKLPEDRRYQKIAEIDFPIAVVVFQKPALGLPDQVFEIEAIHRA